MTPNNNMNHVHNGSLKWASWDYIPNKQPDDNDMSEIGNDDRLSEIGPVNFGENLKLHE